MTPITETPEWHALDAHFERAARRAPPRPVRRRPAARRARSPSRSTGVYLDYSKNRVTDETLRLLVELAERARPARPHRRDVPRREDQRHRGPRRAARRAARARGRGRSRSTARTSSPRCTRCCARWPTSPSACAPGSGPGTPASASATSSTSASAAPTSARTWRTTRSRDFSPARHDVPVRQQRRRHRLLGGDPRPRSRRDAVRRLVEDVHHARDAHQRPQRARVDPRRRSAATSRPSPSTSSRCRPTRPRWRSSASTPPTCSSSGTGSAAATRTTPPSASR